MAQLQDKLKVQRKYAIQLLHQLTAEYPTLKLEMKQISEQYPGSDDEYAVLEEFELLIVSICGYAKQIETTGNVKHLDATIAPLLLRAHWVFDRSDRAHQSIMQQQGADQISR